jgi:hypothetical protein
MKPSGVQYIFADSIHSYLTENQKTVKFLQEDAITECLLKRIITFCKNDHSFLFSLFIFWRFLEFIAKEFFPKFVDLAYAQSSQAIFAKLTGS